MGYIKKTTTLNEDWKILEKIHTYKGTIKKIVVYKKLLLMEQAEQTSMQQHLRDFQGNADEWTESGIPMS